jgi:hypothetical protein
MIKKCPKAKYALSVVGSASKNSDKQSDHNSSALVKCTNSSPVNFSISKQRIKPSMLVVRSFLLFNDKWIQGDYSSDIFSPPRLV